MCASPPPPSPAPPNSRTRPARIRALRTADRAAVAPMWAALFVEQAAQGRLGARQPVRPRLDEAIGRWLDLFLADASHRAWVAVADGAVCGFIAVSLHFTPWLTPARGATIAALWVAPEMRRRRIGHKLVTRAISSLLDLGIDVVDLHAIPFPHAAARFWMAHGFAAVGTQMQRSTA